MNFRFAMLTVLTATMTTTANSTANSTDDLTPMKRTEPDAIKESDPWSEETKVTEVTEVTDAILEFVKVNSPFEVVTEAKVGDVFRFRVSAKKSKHHAEAPFIAVTDCYASYVEPKSHLPIKMSLIDSRGCNKVPPFYDPFRSAGPAIVGGMWFNVLPGLSPPDFYVDEEQATKGIAFSEPFRVFQFPGSSELTCECKIVLCGNSWDHKCFQPACEEASNAYGKRSGDYGNEWDYGGDDDKKFEGTVKGRLRVVGTHCPYFQTGDGKS